MSEKNMMLIFAPHPDDEVLGVGGTIAKRAAQGWKIVDCIVTSDENYNTRRKEAIAANLELGISETVFLDLPELQLDRLSHELFTQEIYKVIQKYKPHEVYLPHPGDLHTDHKALTAAAMVAIRAKYDETPMFAYTYETLSETGIDYQNPQNVFNPNMYVDITDTIDMKIRAFEKHESQIEEFPNSRCKTAIISLAIYRGTQASMNKAEAFSLIRGYER